MRRRSICLSPARLSGLAVASRARSSLSHHPDPRISGKDLGRLPEKWQGAPMFRMFRPVRTRGTERTRYFMMLEACSKCSAKWRWLRVCALRLRIIARVKIGNKQNITLKYLLSFIFYVLNHVPPLEHLEHSARGLRSYLTMGYASRPCSARSPAPRIK